MGQIMSDLKYFWEREGVKKKKSGNFNKQFFGLVPARKTDQEFLHF